MVNAVYRISLQSIIVMSQNDVEKKQSPANEGKIVSVVGEINIYFCVCVQDLSWKTEKMTGSIMEKLGKEQAVCHHISSASLQRLLVVILRDCILLQSTALRNQAFKN
uniref:Uncharacterized protein n=1 Tax=Xiphophorus couchianus TaxID=32473 RepID=A0A3B5LK33_9TELE